MTLALAESLADRLLAVEQQHDRMVLAVLDAERRDAERRLVDAQEIGALVEQCLASGRLDWDVAITISGWAARARNDARRARSEAMEAANRWRLRRTPLVGAEEQA